MKTKSKIKRFTSIELLIVVLLLLLFLLVLWCQCITFM